MNSYLHKINSRQRLVKKYIVHKLQNEQTLIDGCSNWRGFNFNKSQETEDKIRGNLGGKTNLVASLDILDSHELLGFSVSHKPGYAEIAGSNIANELVTIAIVHDWQVHSRPDGNRRAIHRVFICLPEKQNTIP